MINGIILYSKSQYGTTLFYYTEIIEEVQVYLKKLINSRLLQSYKLRTLTRPWKQVTEALFPEDLNCPYCIYVRIPE